MSDYSVHGVLPTSILADCKVHTTFCTLQIEFYSQRRSRIASGEPHGVTMFFKLEDRPVIERIAKGINDVVREAVRSEEPTDDAA